MDMFSICIQFLTVILGFFYPYTLQIIASIDTKYNSRLILISFKRELTSVFFELTLYTTLGLIALSTIERNYRIIQLPPDLFCGKMNHYFTFKILDTIMFGLLCLLVILLVLYANKTLEYLNEVSLIKIIKVKHDKELSKYLESL